MVNDEKVSYEERYIATLSQYYCQSLGILASIVRKIQHVREAIGSVQNFHATHSYIARKSPFLHIYTYFQVLHDLENRKLEIVRGSNLQRGTALNVILMIMHAQQSF